MFSYHRVDIGPRNVDIPVADILGKSEGKTLLVTAGMDGDEYASIEAAYRLADEFAARSFSGRLIIVPIVNVMGFWNECSVNPVDGLFPKMRLIGKKNGSSTELLMHWLSQTFAVGADCWYDAHGGAITERVNPLLWTWRHKRTSGFVDALRNASIAEMFVDDTAGFGSGAAVLAKAGCAYVVGESGERGRREDVDIARHVDWMHGVMHALGMLDEAPTPVDQQAYRRVSFVMAPCEGIWRPSLVTSMHVQKGDVIGECFALNGELLKIVHAPTPGVRMWWKDTMALRKGDVVCAVAS